MIITCPQCGTRYNIKAESVGERGRSVRCSACSHRWQLAAASVPVEPPPVATPQLSPAAAAASRPEPTPLATPPPAAGDKTAGGHNGLAGWLLLALLLLVLIAALVGRNEIVSAFPAAQPVYERLGLPITIQLGLEFRDLTSARREQAGRNQVVVTGEIRNTGGREVEVPPLRVALLDDKQAELQSELFPPPSPRLPPEGAARFEVTLVDPPPAARDFMISFADQP